MQNESPFSRAPKKTASYRELVLYHTHTPYGEVIICFSTTVLPRRRRIESNPSANSS